MRTVDTLPAVLAAVDGEWHHAGCENDDRNHVSPPRSWEGLDLTCPTCKGLGGRHADIECHGGCVTNSHIVTCGDCVDGHPIIDVWACGADPTIRVEPPPVKCEQCYPVRVSIQAIPIYAGDSDRSTWERPCLSIWPNSPHRVEIHWPSRAFGYITLPVGARPGQWGITVTEAP